LRKGVDQFVALRQLFGHHRRRTHHADGHDQRVVGQILDIDDLDRPMLADRLLRHQLADIGVAAAAGAEDGAADGDVFQVFRIDRAQDFHGFFLLLRCRAECERFERQFGITERLRADDFQRPRRLHQVVDRQPDDGDTLAVAQDLRRDRLAGIQLEVDDQVGTMTTGLSSTQSTRFSFWMAMPPRTGPFADAGQQRMSARKAAGQLALDIGDLAGEEQFGAVLLDDPVDDVLAFARASRTVRPISSAWVTVPGTAVRRTKSPRIGATAKPAPAPMQPRRPGRTVSSQNMSTISLKTTTLPLSSAIAAGAALAP
jgi:hypothetical protein